MTQRPLTLLTLILCGLALGACSHWAHETRGARIGVLRCNSVPDTRVNVVLTSSVEVVCTFSTDDREDRYFGETGIQLGLDASYLTREQFWFSVFSAVRSSEPGFLAGRFGGAKAGATLGLGIGVGTLVGGGDGNITLEPFALEVSSGVGVAIGLTYLTLEAVPPS